MVGVSSGAEPRARDPVRVVNRDGASPWIIVCDHASNHVPPELNGLGLPPEELQRHIAWDPGALPVAAALSQRLDAALVESCISRLVIDCNRPLDAPDLIAEVSETTVVPGNAGLSQEDRAARVRLAYDPFHGAVEALVADRVAAGRPVLLAAIHSFTPVYRGTRRPWHIGVLHDEDTSLSGPLLGALRAASGIVVGDNEPYSPADRVYHTLEIHGRSRGLPCVMLELRNDEVMEDAGQKRWADILAPVMAALAHVATLPHEWGGRRIA